MNLPLDPVIQLLHRAPYGTLATRSTALPGYPFATAVPNVLDESHQPLLLVSALAEHTKNLLADPRVGLAMIEPGASDVQAASRLSLIGDAERFTPGAELLARYQRYVPEAESYLQLDFMFFRIVPKRIRYIAGVGRMGWIEAAAWTALVALPLVDEAPLLDLAGQGLPDGIRVLGIDRYGIDFEKAGARQRQAFPGGPLADDALVEQARLFAQSAKH